ncbi:HotDog domain-containing protein [Gorgonomyces haynaldii]|nr:HotDog domain-containing protein [Gorgonomyces haynaldii]
MSLQQLLEIQEIDQDLFSSKMLFKPPGGRGVFGGQYKVHSLHSYFLLPGDNTRPIIYSVLRIRDGKTYCSRLVTAKQRGRIIFSMALRLMLDGGFGSVLNFQIQMPTVPPPESLKSTEDRFRELLKSDDPSIQKYHNAIRARLAQPVTLDMRQVGHKNLGLDAKDPKQMMWIKSIEKLPDNIQFHHCVAAYISDLELLNTTLIPHGLARWGEHRKLTMLASLDHAVWFYQDFRADEWMLYEMETSRSGEGRGFASGRIWSRDGKLIASTAQEGVVRYTVPSKL